jgi:putative flavoprotein involved in K+ transport
VLLGSRVRSIRRAEDRYRVELEDRTYTADQVVIATGPFQVPFMPAIANDLGQDVVQIHSTRYRSPGALPDGPALVVGGGNTGFQIAEELSAAREVHLSIGSRQRRCLNASSVATCSGISRKRARCANRPTRGSAVAWQAETR